MIQASHLLALTTAAMMAVGRVYDDRLTVGGFSFSLLISAVFALVVVLSSLGMLYERGGGRVLGETRADRLYLLPLLLIVVWLAAHVLLIPPQDPAYANEKLITFGLITVPACLVIIRQGGDRLVRTLAICLGGVGGVLILASLPNIASVLTGDAAYGRAAQRLSVFGGGPIVYARWVLTAAIVVALSAVRLPLKVGAVLIALLAAVLAQSKGPVVFFALSLGIVALLYALIRRRYLGAAGIVGGGAAFAVLAPRLIEAMGLGGRLLALFDPGRLLRETSSTARLDVLSLSVEMVRDRPFGVGLGNWGDAADGYLITGRSLQYPHNVFVELAAEVGLALALVVVTWILWCAGSSLRRVVTMVRSDHPNARLAVLTLALFTFYLLGSTVSGDLSDARMMFVTLAMFVAATSLQPQAGNTALLPIRPRR